MAAPSHSGHKPLIIGLKPTLSQSDPAKLASALAPPVKTNSVESMVIPQKPMPTPPSQGRPGPLARPSPARATLAKSDYIMRFYDKSWKKEWAELDSRFLKFYTEKVRMPRWKEQQINFVY